MAAELTCQLIAQPEGQGIGLAVMIALGVIQEREMQIIDFACRYAFPVSGIRNVRRSSSRLVGTDFGVILPIWVVVTAY